MVVVVAAVGVVDALLIILSEYWAELGGTFREICRTFFRVHL